MIVSIAVPALAAILFRGPIQGEEASPSVLASFLSTDPRTFERKLSQARRAPIDARLKASAVKSFYEALPEQGEITDLKDSWKRKVAALDMVLRVHDRASGYDLKVITVQQAYVGVYERAIILVSKIALDMLNTEELQATVAHEMAHEYFWDQWHTARTMNDHSALKQLELYCDGIAMTTLQSIGVRPMRLYDGVRKIMRFNIERFGKAAATDDNYPSLDERKEFAKQVAVWLATTAGN